MPDELDPGPILRTLERRAVEFVVLLAASEYRVISDELRRPRDDDAA